MKKSNNIYHKTLDELKKARVKRLKGDSISIPWDRLPRLSKVLPGVMQEHYTIVSANQKVGKTQLSDFLYLYQPIEWLYNNPESNLDVEILYFSLEMSKEAKMRQAMSYRLFTKYGISISPQKLRSLFGSYILDEKILKYVEKEQEWFKFFESKVTFIDDVRNPFGIFKLASEYLESQGTLQYSTRSFYNQGAVTEEKVRSGIIYDNPDKIYIILTDHISLLSPEREDNGSLYKAIGRFSSEHCLKLRDFYKACVVNVQQQAPTSEEVQFFKGKSYIEKAKPTSDGLGDNKSTARDCNLILFLFDPARYGADNYEEIDLKLFDDSYRELTIGINRDGVANASIGLYFNGSSNYFEEIPELLDENFFIKLDEIDKRRI